MTDSGNLISQTFDWYLRDVLPIVSRNAIQQKYGYHGLYTHTSAVVFRGIDYALAMGREPRPVVLACAFHDMARTHDFADMTHAENAISIVNIIFQNHFPLSANCTASIKYAVKNHTIGTIAPDYISACLWDADRTRLAWECGYDPQFFTTDRAKKIASGNADEYIRFMRDCMSQYARGIITKLDKQY